MSKFVKPSILALVIAISLLGCNVGNKTKDQTVKDIDGNIYNTVQIGTQVWMVENLKTTHYNDGTPIPLIEEGEEWRHMTSPSMCWYNNDIINKNTYGGLYNWYAANNDKICPEGWHVPTEEDWNILEAYLVSHGNGTGKDEMIGKALASSKGWKVSSEINALGNNQSTNNAIGFNAYPSGIRFSNGEFRHLHENAKWWSADESSKSSAPIRFLSYKDGRLTAFSNRKENGFSIRCVRDASAPIKRKKIEVPPIDSEDSRNAMKENNMVVKTAPAQEQPEKSYTYLFSTWDSLGAVRFIQKDLKDTAGWSVGYLSNVPDMTNTTYGVFDMDQKEMNFKIGLSFSEFFDCPPFCGGPAFSIHEFKYIRNGWYLTNSKKGFIQFANWEDYKDSGVFPLTSYDYGMWFKGARVNPRADPSMYSFVEVFEFVDNEFQSVLYSSNDYNDIDCRVFEYNNSSFVRVTKYLEEKSVQENYKYSNGQFSEYTGSFRTMSTEDLRRAGFFNDTEDGVCPTCNGTGLCPLCGGTGKVANGMECNCVRGYKHEVAAGHTPTIIPYKCPQCKGTGRR